MKTNNIILIVAVFIAGVCVGGIAKDEGHEAHTVCPDCGEEVCIYQDIEKAFEKRQIFDSETKSLVLVNWKKYD